MAFSLTFFFPTLKKMYYLLLILYTQKSKIEKDILLKNLIAYQVVEAWNS